MAPHLPLVFHVTYESETWCLWLAGGTQAAQHFARKEDAVRVGVRHAAAARPSQLLVHSMDGTLELKKAFGPHAEAKPEDSSEYYIGRGQLPTEEL